MHDPLETTAGTRLVSGGHQSVSKEFQDRPRSHDKGVTRRIFPEGPICCKKQSLLPKDSFVLAIVTSQGSPQNPSHLHNERSNCKVKAQSCQKFFIAPVCHSLERIVMAFAIHPLLSTYPGASFVPNGNLNGPHWAMRSGGDSTGYWGHVPWEIPQPGEWSLPPAVVAMMEGRGTGMYGVNMEGGMRYNYGWPKYGPVSHPQFFGRVSKLTETADAAQARVGRVW